MRHRLDVQSRGYVDLTDLQALVAETVHDGRTRLKLTTLIAENLEYRNADCVFYSPLLALPPPYFRSTPEVDQADLVVKFYRELAALDSH